MTSASVCGGDGIIAQRVLSCVLRQWFPEGTTLGTRNFRKIAIARVLSLCRCDKSFVTEKDLMLQVVPRGRLSDPVGNETPVPC